MSARATRLARGGLLNLVGAGVAAGSGLALVLVVTAGFPSRVAGAFFAATSVFLILGAACELGSGVGLVRHLPRYLVQGRNRDARRCLRLAAGPVLAVACLAAVALYAAAPWLGPRIASGDSPGEIVAMLRVLAIFLPFAACRNVVLAASRGYGSMRPTVVVEKLTRSPAQVAGSALVLAFGGGPLGLAYAWGVPYLVGLVAACGWFLVIARRGGRDAAEGDEDLGRYSPAAGERADGLRDRREIAGEFWRYTAPRAIAHICQISVQRADIVLVAALRSPQEAALYTVVTRFIVIGQLGAQAVQQVMQPALARLLTRGDADSAAWVFRMATTWIIACTVPVYAFVAVAAPLYLSVVGSGGARSGQLAVVILAFAMALAAVSGPVDGALLMAGRSGLSLANNTAALAVDMVLNVALIPPFGVTGAAIAWAAAIVTRNLLPLVQVRSLLALSPFSVGSCQVAVAAVACFGALPLLVRLFTGTNPVAVVAVLVPCAAAYVGLLWAVRGRIALTTLPDLLGRGTHPTGRGTPVPGGSR